MNENKKTVEALIQFKCPGCDRVVHAAENMAGETVPCSKCKALMTVPDGGELVLCRPPVVDEASRFRFNCPGCGKGFSGDRAEFDDLDELPCKKCRLMLSIPAVQGEQPVARPFPDLPAKKKTVAMSLAMPRGLGSMKTEVTQKTADSMASTFLGGLLTVIGAILMGMFMRRGGRA